MTERGFTLVELMVVLLIMGVVGGAVMLVARDSRGVEADAARFASRIAAARDLAVTSNRPVSVWVSQTGYGFEELQGGAWRPLDAALLKPGDWPTGTSVTAAGLAGQASKLSGGATRLVFDNLGMPDPPATLSVGRDDRQAEVSIAANGDVSLR